MQQAIEQVFEKLVLGPEIDENDPAAVDAWLQGSDLPPEDREALRGDFARLCVYRKLVRGTLREAVELAMPRTAARLGQLFDEHFSTFLGERPPRSHYLRDVANDFLSYFAQAQLRDARLPAWAPELARHEALRIEIGAMPVAPAPASGEQLALERTVRFSEASRVVRYAYAVHRLSDDEADVSQPAASPTALFVYRSPEHEVRYLELSPVAAALLERLGERGQTLQEALSGACQDLCVPLDQSVLEGTARLLADLAERGVLLGPGPAAA